MEWYRRSNKKNEWWQNGYNDKECHQGDQAISNNGLGKAE
jgi:hypothetical protein